MATSRHAGGTTYKKNCVDAPCCLSRDSTEKPMKSTKCSKDSLDYDWIKKRSKEQGQGQKRLGLYDQAQKLTSTYRRKRETEAPENHAVRKWSD
jgi:hypothetical protein